MVRRVGISDAVRARLSRVLGDTVRSVRPAPSHKSRAPDLVPLSVARPYGDTTRGAEVLKGFWSYAGQTVDVGAHGHPFSVSLPSERFADWLHSHIWLYDLLSVEGGAEKAGQLLAHWTDAFAGGNDFVFGPDLLARRMLVWGRIVFALPDPNKVLAARYGSQMRALRRDLSRLSPGLSALYGQCAMVIHGARRSDRADTFLAKGLDGLDAEIDEQILADGGHISRAPMTMLNALDALSATDAVLQAAGLEASRTLSRAIDRMVPMVATLRHTDGGMAVFHGGSEGDPARIQAVLKTARPDGNIPRPFAFSPHTGYHRLDAGESIVIIDAQGVPPRPHDLEAHLAPLATEISTAEGRLMVNCGWHQAAAPAWRRPVRASAAHSTLTLGDRSPGEILEEGFMAKTLGQAIAIEPGSVRARRKEQSSGIWLESSHDGYKDEYGLVHRRRLFMGEDGNDIRGEDSLFVPVGDTPLHSGSVPFTLRFHFHPDVQVSLAQDLSSALLVQRGKAGWRFRTDGGPIAVEPSVYLAGGARPIRAQQLVMTGSALADGDGQGTTNRVRWSLRRLKGRSA